MSALAPGFADPPLAAQACFRRLLEAMARPGTVVTLDPPPAPPPLAPAAGAVALTLCDADTPVWLDAALAVPAVLDWLRFHAGCRIVAAPEEAAFAFAADPAVPFDRFQVGSDEYPDRSATVVLQIDAFGAGAALLDMWAVPALVTLGVALVGKVRIEERLLRQTYPGYEEYSRRSWGLIPFLW